MIRSVRIFKVQKCGELHDKLQKDVNLLLEADPQGIIVKLFAGNYRVLRCEMLLVCHTGMCSPRLAMSFVVCLATHFR